MQHATYDWSGQILVEWILETWKFYLQVLLVRFYYFSPQIMMCLSW
jgi:hypothetical protein